MWTFCFSKINAHCCFSKGLSSAAWGPTLYHKQDTQATESSACLWWKKQSTKLFFLCVCFGDFFCIPLPVWYFCFPPQAQLMQWQGGVALSLTVYFIFGGTACMNSSLVKVSFSVFVFESCQLFKLNGNSFISNCIFFLAGQASRGPWAFSNFCRHRNE